MNNLHSIFKNQDIYCNECKILITLVQNNIRVFDIETIQKIAYIEEQNRTKTTLSSYNKTISAYCYTFEEVVKKALFQLVRPDILEYKSMTFYEIKDEIFNEVKKWI